jgi:predicted Rossmann-fold nucleotide-binding protein
MNPMASTRSRAIIGVVGRTLDAKALVPDSDLPIPDRELLRLAQEIGQLIAAEEHVVLTGGHHKSPETSVKYRALVGAAQVLPDTPRVIGILPKSISDAVKVKPVDACLALDEPPLRCLYVHTGLPSKKRNPLTGNAVDALIALTGQSGTPQEVDAAIEAGRPVVFLKSWKVLQPLLTRPPTDLLLAETADEAVEKALNAVGLPDGPTPSLKGHFPPTFAAYPDHQMYARLKAKYEQELPRLCSD